MIFLTQFLKHVDEIIEKVFFIISKISFIIVIKTRLIDSSDFKNMCDKNEFLDEFMQKNFSHLKFLLKLSKINVIINVDFKVF